MCVDRVDLRGNVRCSLTCSLMAARLLVMPAAVKITEQKSKKVSDSIFECPLLVGATHYISEDRVQTSDAAPTRSEQSDAIKNHANEGRLKRIRFQILFSTEA